MYSRLKRFAFRRFKKAETNLHELNYLFWECTTRCNLNCIHCGSDCSKDSNYQDMPLEDFLNALDIKFSCEGYVGEYETRVRDTPFFCRAGINIGSILIDGSISACPNIDRSFIQGNIYKDNFYHVWQNQFTPFRDRKWTSKGRCADCKDYRDCQGNGFHNWHGEKEEVLVCHKAKLDHKETASREAVS